MYMNIRRWAKVVMRSLILLSTLVESSQTKARSTTKQPFVGHCHSPFSSMFSCDKLCVPDYALEGGVCGSWLRAETRQHTHVFSYYIYSYCTSILIFYSDNPNPIMWWIEWKKLVDTRHETRRQRQKRHRPGATPLHTYDSFAIDCHSAFCLFCFVV